MASNRDAQDSSEFAERTVFTRDYDDNADVDPSAPHESHASTREPLSNFRTEEEDDEDLEDGFVRRPTRGRRSWWNWWDNVRVEGYRGLDGGRTQLPDGYAARRTRKKSNWYNCCIFGGISCCAFLLVLDLLLGLVTLFRTSDIDTMLRNWGKLGTGTEGLAWYPTDFTRDIVPILCHSHNDYWRKAPLFSALRIGCIGVEADVWLFDEELYVGHNTASLTRNRTFTSLYVDPLVKILEQQNPSHEFYNGTSHGVFDESEKQTLTLLVDLKTSGVETWVVKQVQPLRERGWLSFVENDKFHSRPVTLVGTGNAPWDLVIANSTYRDAFFDAPLDKMWEAKKITPKMESSTKFKDSLPGKGLDEDESSAEEQLSTSSETRDLEQGLSGTLPDTQFNRTNSYYASVSFRKTIGRLWGAKLSPKQMEIIRGQIRGAHRRGLKVRYWDTPAWPIGLRNHVWDVLVQEGVDLLNVDDLEGASKQVW